MRAAGALRDHVDPAFDQGQEGFQPDQCRLLRRALLRSEQGARERLLHSGGIAGVD